jgi:hypothetical protein
LVDHLDLVLSLILDTTDLPTILDGRRRRDKRKGLDLFFIRREFISLRDAFDVPARGAIHATVATVMKHLVAQHQKLFGDGSTETASAVDYGKLDDKDYWLEEAQCITVRNCRPHHAWIEADESIPLCRVASTALNFVARTRSTRPCQTGRSGLESLASVKRPFSRITR